jgi:hypothetical protein
VTDRGLGQLGESFLDCVQITSKGIDAVESVINQSVPNIAMSDTNEEARAEAIINESERRSKLQKFCNCIGENAGWIELVAI